MNIIFNDIEGDDNIIPLYTDGNWNYTQGTIYTRLPYFASLAFYCKTNNRLIESNISQKTFRTTSYANELINEGILSFLFVFNNIETSITVSEIRAIPPSGFADSGLSLQSLLGNINDNVDVYVPNHPIGSNTSAGGEVECTIDRVSVIRKPIQSGLGIILKGVNYSNGIYDTFSLYGGVAGLFDSVENCNGYLIPQYLK